MDWSQFPNFTEAEFRCKHTGKCHMTAEFMTRLQALRRELGRPLVITSGYRDPSHPVEAAKASTGGEHTRGCAADIACATGAERFELVRLALKHGFTRIGIAKTFVHLGTGGPGLPANVIWEYA